MKFSLKILSFILFCILLSFQNIQDPLSPIINPIEKEGWELTFNDEFDSTFLDRNKWRNHVDWGQSLYDDNQHLNIDSAFILENGILKIEARRQDTVGLVRDNEYNAVQKSFQYTSGLIHSASSFKQRYGYFEIRCKVPGEKGFWSTFWLLHDQTWPPEVDILEHRSIKPNEMHMAFHFKDEKDRKRQHSKTIRTVDLSKNFHTYAFEWNEDELIWYLDNKRVFRSKKQVPEGKMYIIASLAVGGGWSGFVDDTTPFPAYMEIDYIRVYKKKE